MGFHCCVQHAPTHQLHQLHQGRRCPIYPGRGKTELNWHTGKQGNMCAASASFFWWAEHRSCGTGLKRAASRCGRWHWDCQRPVLKFERGRRRRRTNQRATHSLSPLDNTSIQQGFGYGPSQEEEQSSSECKEITVLMMLMYMLRRYFIWS